MSFVSMRYKINGYEIITLQNLSEKEKNAFSEKLYEVTLKIFGGGSKQEFEEMVTKCDSLLSRFLIYKNKNNEWVGYFGIHRFRKKIDGKNVTVFRSQAGLLPEYRRSNAKMSFPIKEILRYKWKHPKEEVYCFVAIINPSMYCIADKNIKTVYPSPGKVTPDHIKHIISQCAIQFHFDKKDGDTFWARTIGWFPINTTEEVQFWKTSTDKRIRFYQKLNPHFLEGKGLLTLIPLTTKDLLISILHFVYYSFRKKVRFILRPRKK